MAIRPTEQAVNNLLTQVIEDNKENIDSTILTVAQVALSPAEEVITQSIDGKGKGPAAETARMHAKSQHQEMVKEIVARFNPNFSTSVQLLKFLAHAILQTPEPSDKEEPKVEVNQEWVSLIPVLFQEGLGRYLTDGQQTQVLRIVDQLKSNQEFATLLTPPRCRSKFKNLIIRDLKLNAGHKIQAIDISRAALLALLSRAYQYQDGNCYLVAPFMYAQAEHPVALLKFFWEVLSSRYVSINESRVRLDSLLDDLSQPLDDKNTLIQFVVLKVLDLKIQNSKNELKFLYDYFKSTLTNPLLIIPEVRGEGHRLGGLDLKGRVRPFKTSKEFFNWVAPRHEQHVEWVKYVLSNLHHNLDPDSKNVEPFKFKKRGRSAQLCLTMMESLLGPCHLIPLPARSPEELVEQLRRKELPGSAAWVLPEHLAYFDRTLLLMRESPEERQKRIEGNERGNYNIAYQDFAKAYKVPYEQDSEEMGNPLSLAIELQQYMIESGRRRQSLPELTNLICDRFGLPRMEFLGTANWSHSDCEFFILALHSFETNQLEIVYTNGYDITDVPFDPTFTSQLLYSTPTV